MSTQSERTERTLNIFSLYLLQTITELMGPEMAKGSLERVGEAIAEKLLQKFGADSLHVVDLKDLTKNANPLKFFDDTLEAHGGMVYVIERCPFVREVRDFLELNKEMPPLLSEIVEIYNREGLGYAVSPFCIIHQTLRAKIVHEIKVGDKGVEFLQLGCKAPSGKIKLADQNIKKVGSSDTAVQDILKSRACCYAISPKP